MTISRRPTFAALLALLLAALLVPAVPRHAEASPPQDCFWTSVFDEENGNLFYPDTGVNYYLGRVTLPPGGELVVRGRYPHARYTSFNTYDELFRPVDALADVAIRPQRGSINPFRVGNRRDLPRRDYAVRVVSDPEPERRAPNTVYLGTDGRPAFAGAVVYRVYLPDSGRGQFGGVGLPEVALRMPDGREVHQPLACTAPTNQPSTGVTRTDQSSSGPALPNHTTASMKPDWERFFNVSRTLTRQFSEEGAEVHGHEQRGGLFSDANNAYVYAFIAREYGDLLVLKGRLPDVPATHRGERVFQDAQLRYWSMCSVSVQPYGVTDTVGCVNDSRLVVDDDRTYTIVVSTPEDRPANARRRCGVTWIPFGARPTAALVMRNQLPDPSFAQAVQKVTEPGRERAVMGEHLPRGGYRSTESFERREC